MMSDTLLAAPRVLDAEALPSAVAEAVLDRALAAPVDAVILDIVGPGAVASLQGLLTTDVEKPGDGGHAYGAILTPKGMILSDLWIWREAAGATLVIPPEGADAVREIFTRSLPPRLARVSERAGMVLLRVAGPETVAALARVGLTVPEPGRIQAAITDGIPLHIARPTGPAAFIADLLIAQEHLETLRRRLARAGVMVNAPSGLELARVLAGWPRLGVEIGDKTLPQEVRLDEIGGVSYTKGCYTGQETVARVHFRGHPNRHLVGLIWDGVPNGAIPDITQDDQPRGRVGTVLWLEPVERWIGLALLRREVALDRPVLAAGAEATVVELPFRIDP